MSKAITSKIIGQMPQDETFDNWWNSQEIEISFFDNKKLAIIFSECEPEKDETFIVEADAALDNFLKLTSEDRKSISELAYKNCMDFFEAIGFNEETVEMYKGVENPDWWHLQGIKNGELLNLKHIDEVWNYIHPTKIYVTRRPYNEPYMFVQVVCECDWEEEHGLQLVFKLGKKLTRISYQDGHLTEADAYGKSDEEDELLSKF
jgi:hypothetical protein